MKAKKVLAMLMASAMIMGSTVTAFAAVTPTTVTVNVPQSLETEEGVGNPEENAEVKYMQLIEPDQNSTLGWKFSSDVIKSAFVNEFGDDALTDVTNLYLNNQENPTNSNAANGVIHSSVELADAVRNLTPPDESKDHVTKGIETDTNESWSFTADKAGLYLVTVAKQGYSYIPMLAYVEDTASGVLKAATVTAKGSEDQIYKKLTDTESADGDKSVAKGDIVNYTVNTEYPYYADSVTEQTFEITDTLTNGTFEGIVTPNLTVKIGGDDAIPFTSEGTDWDYKAELSQGNTVLTITFNYKKAKASQDVEITYNVEVGEVTSDSSLSNHVVQETSKGTEYIVKSDSASFKVIKTGDAGVKLGGAEFTVYEQIDGTNYEGMDEEDLKTLGIKKATINDEEVYLKEIDTKTTTTRDEAEVAENLELEGTCTFEGLDVDKTYYVQETKAPEGYKLNENYYELNRTDPKDGETTTSSTNGNITTITTVYTVDDYDDQSVVDTKLADLPSTGGIGTTIFTIGGCVIMVTAAGLYFATRRKEQN